MVGMGVGVGLAYLGFPEVLAYLVVLAYPVVLAYLGVLELLLVPSNLELLEYQVVLELGQQQ